MRFKEGNIPWNKGLTKEIDERIKKQAKKQSKTLKRFYEEGKLKVSHSKETRKKISNALKGRKNPNHSEILKKMYREGKIKHWAKDKKFPWLTERNINNNSAKDPKVRKKISNTLKRLSIEGKIRRWNKGLTKEMDIRIKKNTEKSRITLKRRYANGEIDLNSGCFRKGQIPWNKGLTKENNDVIKNISLRFIGRKGKSHSEETKNKISKKLKGKKYGPFSEDHREKLSIARRKRITTKETKKKMQEARAKQKFPLQDTSIEIKIQNYLKILGYDFHTHFYIKEIKHQYRCDIFVPLYNLVIECDGNYWHGNPKYFKNLTEKQETQKERDDLRTKELLEKGFNVIRIWEDEIKKMSLEDFKKKVWRINGSRKSREGR